MQDKKNLIVLLGYMYSGKTTIGKKLARLLGYTFYDLDYQIETKYHYSVERIFSIFGEDVFRNMEKDMLDELLQKNNAVISLGGGTPCFFDNMDKIKQQSYSVYIKMDAAAILSRHKCSKKIRPLFMSLSENQTEEYILNSLKRREPYYNQADITVDGINANVVQLAEIIKS